MSEPPPPPPTTIHGSLGTLQQAQVSGSVRDIVGEQRNYYLAPSRPIDPADLTAAQALLAQMPVGDDVPIPLPGLLAPYSFLNQLIPNPLFTGRDAELRVIAQALRDTLGTALVIAGIGGVGKTQLALEFAHRYGPYFAGGVFWVSCADPAGVATSVAACGARGLIDWRPDYGQIKLDGQLALVGQAWQSPLPRLLVFDNCEDAALLRQWQPPTGGCRVLITSRRASWGATHALTHQPLKELRRDIGAHLLLQYRADLGAGAAQIADAVGGLPLALHLAGSYLRRYRSTTAAVYLGQLTTALVGHPSLQGRAAEASPTGHDLSIQRTFAISYDQLRPEEPVDATARALLDRAACLAPSEPISRELLLATLELAEGDDAAAMQAEDGVARLIELGLIEEEAAGSLRLHRLIADYVRSERSAIGAQAGVERALRTIMAERIDVARHFAPLDDILSHLRFTVEHIVQRRDAEAATLVNNVGYYLKQIGDYTTARLLYEQTLAIREHLLGATHPQTADSLNNLAELLRVMGEYTIARVFAERALSVTERVYGHTHLDTAISLNNLALLLEAEGKFEEARLLLQQALEIRTQILGLNHPDTAQSLGNLAGVLDSVGDYEAARPLYERALDIRERALGALHPKTATSLNNLAVLFFNIGNYPKALALHRRALAIREQIVGLNPLDTAHSMSNLAVVLTALGDYEAARPFHEQALKICETILGPTHPSTATKLNNLASFFQALKEYRAALPLFKRVLTIRKHIFTSPHPDIAASLQNLAVNYYAQGQLTEAKTFMQQALAMYEHSLGPHHPNTNTSRQRLIAMQQSVAEDTVPRSDTAQIRAIIQQAEVAVAQALAGESDAQRALLSQQLEKVAQQVEDGEDAESPWLALAVHLRALAKKLSESGASTVRHTS